MVILYGLLQVRLILLLGLIDLMYTVGTVPIVYVFNTEERIVWEVVISFNECSNCVFYRINQEWRLSKPSLNKMIWSLYTKQYIDY